MLSTAVYWQGLCRCVPHSKTPAGTELRNDDIGSMSIRQDLNNSGSSMRFEVSRHIVESSGSV